MAQIDLSKFTPNVPQDGRQQQYFAEGDTNAYKAMASLGNNMANYAIDLHNKELDIATDREATNAVSELRMRTTNEQNRALQNIDKNNFVLDENGTSTQKTYDQHIADFIDQNKQSIDEGLSENISRTKYQASSAGWVTETKTKAVFKNTELVTKNSVKDFDEGVSQKADEVLYSETGNIGQKLNDAYGLIDSTEGQILRKATGETAYRQKMDQTKKTLYEAAMESSIRNMKSDPNSVADFSQLIGLGLMFGNKGAGRGYIIQKYMDTMEGNPDKEEAEKYVDELFGNPDNPKANVLGENATLTDGAHPFADTLKPEEKKQYLDRALAIIFKDKKQKEDNSRAALGDWQAAPSRRTFDANDTSAWLDEGARIMTSDGYKGNNVTRVRDAYKAADMKVMQDARVYLLEKGPTAYNQFIKNSDALRSTYAKSVIDRVMSEDEYAVALKSNPSVGDNYAHNTESSLLNVQRDLNLKKVRDPMYFAEIDPIYPKLSGQALKIKDGNILIDQKALTQLDMYTKQTMRRVGTAQSALDSTNVLPKAQMKDFMDTMQIMTPDKQLAVYNQISKASPALATSLYTQAVKQGKMTLEEASLAANSQLGDTKSANAMTEQLISLSNKYTGKPEAELIKKMQTEGFLGINHGYSDVLKMIDKSVANDKYTQDMKAAAKASGLSDAAINNYFQDKNLQRITLDKLSKTLPESNSMMDAIIPGTLQRKIDKAYADAANEFYGSRIQPIVGDSIKGTYLPDTISDPEKVKSRASALAGKVKDALNNGQLHLDFSDYEGMKRAEKYKNGKLSDELKQKYFMRDVAESVSFNSTDVTGHSPELVAMIKDPSSGAYYRIKLKTPDGKSFTPMIPKAREFESFNENELYDRYFANAQHTKQLGNTAPTPISKRK